MEFLDAPDVALEGYRREFVLQEPRLRLVEMLVLLRVHERNRGLRRKRVGKLLIIPVKQALGLV